MLRVYDRVDKDFVESYGPFKQITKMAVSKDDTNQWAAVGLKNGDVFVVDRVHDEILHLVSTLDSITCLEFSLFFALLSVGSLDGRVNFYNIEQSIEPQISFKAHGSQVSSIQSSPVNKIFHTSCGTDGKVCFYDLSSFKIVNNLTFNYIFTAMAYKNDGYTIALGTKNGQIVVIDLQKFKNNPLIYDVHVPDEIVHLEYRNYVSRRKSVIEQSFSKKTKTTPIKKAASPIKQYSPIKSPIKDREITSPIKNKEIFTTHEEIEKMIQDAMVPLRLMIHNDLKNMHIELLRQFEFQRLELESLMQQFSEKKKNKLDS